MYRQSKGRTTLSIIALLALCAAVAGAVEPREPRIQAVVEFASQAEWEAFRELPGLDIMKAKPGVMARIVTDAEELEELQGKGFSVVVEIGNMEEHYARRIRGDNFGDFHTYSETIDFLDALHAAYPSITTARDSIGTTHEGRALWVMKISDNPDVDEEEPEALFDGLHHAREPISVEVIMEYMEWLCEGYGTDPGATWLVDNREIWFLPIVNPDGFVYNELTYPSGGGMWRKNMRDNAGTSCDGVDPNRNYPHHWGEVGISFDPCSDVYCGPSAGSEPEIQAYMAFVADHEFVTNITFHSVAALILLPYGYDYTVHTPDDALFRELGNVMAETNGYPVGQAGEVLYDCSGTTCDWAYDEHGVLSMCVEVGGTGFWPAESEIPGLRAECLWPQIYLTQVAGSYLSMAGLTMSGGDGDQDPEPGEALEIAVTVGNDGVSESAQNVAVTLASDDPYVHLTGAADAIGTIAPRSTATNGAGTLAFTVDPSTPDGHVLTLTVGLTADGFSAQEDLVWLVGTPETYFADDMESGTGNWTATGSWALTTSESHSSSHSFTDSPTGWYPNSSNTWIELASPLDFSDVPMATLSFWHDVETEEDYDFCYVEATTDGGSTWTPIGPKYHGSGNPWEQVELSLDAYAGSAALGLRFRFQTDTYVQQNGWFIDDVVVSGPPIGNALPGAPTLDGPGTGETVSSPTPTLSVVNAIDPDPGDVLTYGYRVYTDELCTDLVTSTSGVVEGSGTTAWTVDTSLADGTYWWRAYADDGTEGGPLMGAASFTVEATGVEGGLPATLVLYPARPNPSREGTAVSFELPAASKVRLAVYSVDGRLVRTILDDDLPPGAATAVWDGRDDRGVSVGNGLYFARLEAAGAVRHAKIVRIR